VKAAKKRIIIKRNCSNVLELLAAVFVSLQLLEPFLLLLEKKDSIIQMIITTAHLADNVLHFTPVAFGRQKKLQTGRASQTF